MTRTVPLSSLALEHANWANPRLMTGLEDSDIKDLADDIKAKHKAGHPSGIEVPLHVVMVKTVNDEYINLTIDGQRRFLAASLVLPKNHMIEVIDLVPEAIELTPDRADDLMLRALSIGSKREGLSAFELSEVAERLRNRGKTLLEIGQAIKKSESWVSKILKARMLASQKLLFAWRKKEITEEQFRELANQKDSEKQAAATDDVVKTRKSGDKSEARAKSKEIKERERVAKRREKDSEVELERRAEPKDKNGAPRPTQADMWSPPPPVAESKTNPKPPAKPTIKKPSSAELEQMLDLATNRPPTHDYVKGMMDGVRHALGLLLLNDAAKPWHQYILRLGGTTKPKKSKPARKARAAKARKPAKKSKGKR